MKFHCKVDGVHFPQEFEETLKPPCNFWGDFGLANLQPELKKKFWDWLFTMPSDEIALLAKVAIGVTFSSFPVTDQNDWFKTKIPDYESWSELEQQKFQKVYFQASHQGLDMDKWILPYTQPKKVLKNN